MKIVIIICVLILVAIIFLKPKWFKNFLGKLQGYGTCPNCGDSMIWKPFGLLIYEEKDFSHSSGIMACHECLTSRKLNKEKMTKRLKKYHFENEKIKLLCHALDRQEKAILN